MTQHPHQLHAQAALWSLHAALAYLGEHREAILVRRPQLGPPATRPRSLASLQRQAAQLVDERPDRARLVGSKAGTTAAPGDAPGLADLERDVAEALEEALGLLAYAHHRHPLLALSPLRLWQEVVDVLAIVPGDARWVWAAAVLPVTQPMLAEAVELILRPVDERVRAYAGLDQDRFAPPRAPACPACDMRRLRVHCSAPDSARWTIVCTPSCRCIGAACPCGMDVPMRGTQHIWGPKSKLAASVLAGVAVGLAA